MSISYRVTERDTQLAQQFHDELEQQGHQVFLAQKDLHLGETWPQRLEEELKQADYLLLFLSEEATTSEMVIVEVRMAIQTQTCLDDDVYFWLWGVGLIASREGNTAKPHCQLYARYFQE